MAIAPLFISDMEALKSKMRLTGAARTDSLAIIDTCVSEVRLGFFDALSAARVAVLVAIVPSDAPTTDDEIMRSKAELCEAEWVRMLLLRRLPNLFLDSSGQTKQVWNEERIERESTASLEKEIARMQAQIADWIGDLTGETEPTFGSIQCDTIGPLEEQPRPGASIQPLTRSQVEC